MKIKSAILLFTSLSTITSKAMNEETAEAITSKATSEEAAEAGNVTDNLSSASTSVNNDEGSVDGKENVNDKKDDSCAASLVSSEAKLEILEEIICKTQDEEISRSSTQEDVTGKSSETTVAQETSSTNDASKNILEKKLKRMNAEEAIRGMSTDCLEKALENKEINSVLNDEVVVLFLKKYGCKKTKILVNECKKSCTNQADDVADSGNVLKVENFEKTIRIYEAKSIILKISTLVFIASAVYLTDNLLSVHFKHSFKSKIFKFIFPSLTLLFSGAMIYCSYINVDILHDTISKYIN